MPSKNQFIILLVLLIIAFAVGRYSITSNQQPEVQVTKTKDQVKDVDTHKVITRTKSPTGEVKTVTIIDTTSIIKTSTETAKAVIPAKNAKLNVSALIAFNHDYEGPKYGISVTKEGLGPFTGGIWGLNNGTLGLSLGVDF